MSSADTFNLYRSEILFYGKILDGSKFKAFADDKMNVAQMMTSVFDRVENIVGKGENAGYQHFFFPPIFQKVSFHVVFKSRDCVVKNYGFISIIKVLIGPTTICI